MTWEHEEITRRDRAVARPTRDQFVIVDHHLRRGRLRLGWGVRHILHRDVRPIRLALKEWLEIRPKECRAVWGQLERRLDALSHRPPSNVLVHLDDPVRLNEG